MKRKTSYILITAGLMILFLLSIPVNLTAMGNSEKAAANWIEEDFYDIAAAFQDGEIEKEEALAELHALHDEKGNGDLERLREMEQLLTAIELKEMNAEQAREQLRVHQDDGDNTAADQLRTQDKVQLQDRVEDPDCEPLNDKLQTKTQDKTQTSKTDSDSGNQTEQHGSDTAGNSGGSPGKQNGKN